MPYAKEMKDIYQRLGTLGYAATYIRQNVLPDWWEDALGNTPQMRQHAEIAIAGFLGVPPATLADRGAPLDPPAVAGYRLKKREGADSSKIAVCVHLASRLAHVALKALPTLPPERPLPAATALRDALVAQHGRVDLRALVEAAWAHGIPVLRLRGLPKGMQSCLDGVALTVQDRPVIVLSSNRREAACLLWHLAHELGHIALGHLNGGDHVDAKITDDAPMEREANDFARTLVANDINLISPDRYLSASAVEREDARLAQIHQLDRGVVALNWAFNMDRRGEPVWPTAIAAVRRIEADRPASDAADVILAAALAARLETDRLMESEEHFLLTVTGLDAG